MTASQVIVGVGSVVGIVVIVGAIWLQDRACPDCGRPRGTPSTDWAFDPITGSSRLVSCSDRDFHPPP